MKILSLTFSFYSIIFLYHHQCLIRENDSCSCCYLKNNCSEMRTRHVKRHFLKWCLHFCEIIRWCVHGQTGESKAGGEGPMVLQSLVSSWRQRARLRLRPGSGGVGRFQTETQGAGEEEEETLDVRMKVRLTCQTCGHRQPHTHHTQPHVWASPADRRHLPAQAAALTHLLIGLTWSGWLGGAALHLLQVKLEE